MVVKTAAKIVIFFQGRQNNSSGLSSLREGEEMGHGGLTLFLR